MRAYHLVALALAIVMSRPMAGQDAKTDPTDPLGKPSKRLEINYKDFKNEFLFVNFEGLDKKYPLPQDRGIQTKYRNAVLKYYEDRYLSPFEKSAGAKASWADAARSALKAYCAANARTSAAREGVYYQEFVKALAAVDPACDDPLIQYLRQRHVTVHKKHDSAKARVDENLRNRLRESGQYPILAAHASHNIRALLISIESQSAGRTNEDLARAKAQYDEDYARAVGVANKRDWLDLFELAMLEIEFEIPASSSRVAAWEKVDARLKKCRAPDWLRDTVAGKSHVQAAWEARGSGPGASVDDDAHASFTNRLKKGKQYLEAAWNAETELDTPATSMLYAAKGLGFSREEMEKWFQRAMEANPDNFAACEAKKDWLMPHWHGAKDSSDVLHFCVQCANSNNFYGKLPYIAETVLFRSMPVSHLENMKEIGKHSYHFWFVRTVSAAHLERYPDDRWARSRYAYMAANWKEWDIAHAQFEALGDRPWSGWFVHEGEYEFVKQYAKENRKNK
jgi:hypothetical protein